MNASIASRFVWFLAHSCAGTGVLIAALVVPPVIATDAQFGDWEDPIKCQGYGGDWPDGAMHAVHVVVRGENGLEGRILIWYAPGCLYEGINPATCGEDDPVFLDLADCASHCTYSTSPPSPFATSCSNAPARLWNPADDSYDTIDHSPYQSGTSIESLRDCGGQTHLSDGRVIVGGGGCGPEAALKQTLIFNPFDGSWTAVAATPQMGEMADGRYYPTTTTLPDGQIIIVAGSYPCDYGDCQHIPDTMVETPEVFSPYGNSWRQLSCLDKKLPYYPFMFVLRDGRLFFAGPGRALEYGEDDPEPGPSGVDTFTGVLTLTGDSPGWSLFPSHFSEDRDFEWFCDHGSAVMYRPGKILKCGGGHPSSATHCNPARNTAVIDLSGSIDPDEVPAPELTTPPVWQDGPTMNTEDGRKDHNLVLLADGTILMVGGVNTCGELNSGSCSEGPAYVCNNLCSPVKQIELLHNPDADAEDMEWIPMTDTDMQIPRGYHSTAMLLADGKVLCCGGENWFDEPDGNSSKSAEIYQPGYLFRGDRPALTTPYPPESLKAGQSFNVAIDTSSGHASSIAKAALVRLAAVTHGFDENQRYVPLATPSLVSTVGSTKTYSLTVPSNVYDAPPGFYMLFLLSPVESSTVGGVPSVARYVRIIRQHVEDIDYDCHVDGIDLSLLLGQWSGDSTYTPYDPVLGEDLDGDHKVNGADLAALLAAWTDDTDFLCHCVITCDTPPGCGEGGGSSAPQSMESMESGIALFLQWLENEDWEAFFEWLTGQ